MVSVSGFKELASAFSSEDLYSNMLGAKLAKQVLLDNPELDQKGFSKAMDSAFKQALKDLKAQSKAVTKEKIQQLASMCSLGERKSQQLELRNVLRRQ